MPKLIYGNFKLKDFCDKFCVNSALIPKLNFVFQLVLKLMEEVVAAFVAALILSATVFLLYELF